MILLLILPLVLSCPSPPTTTTTTRRPGLLTYTPRMAIEVAGYDRHSMYPDCPKFFSECRIVELDNRSMVSLAHDVDSDLELDYNFAVSSNNVMRLDVNKTHELDQNYLTYFRVSIRILILNFVRIFTIIGHYSI